MSAITDVQLDRFLAPKGLCGVTGHVFQLTLALIMRH